MRLSSNISKPNLGPYTTKQEQWISADPGTLEYMSSSEDFKQT
jgi:hypothetical protein